MTLKCIKRKKTKTMIKMKKKVDNFYKKIKKYINIIIDRLKQ